MQKKLWTGLACGLLMLGIGGVASANTVTIGQTSTLTDFNFTSTGFFVDGYNILPFPDERVASVVGNTALVSLVATPGHACQPRAEIGVIFDWDFQRYTFEQVKNFPIKVTFDFDYAISAVSDSIFREWQRVMWVCQDLLAGTIQLDLKWEIADLVVLIEWKLL